MRGYSCKDLRKDIIEDIDEFIADGLNVRQATSRVQVEYAQLIEECELAELIIYIVLSQEGFRHGCLRTDVKSKALHCINNTNVKKYENHLDEEQLSSLKREIEFTSEIFSTEGI